MTYMTNWQRVQLLRAKAVEIKDVVARELAEAKRGRGRMTTAHVTQLDVALVMSMLADYIESVDQDIDNP